MKETISPEAIRELETALKGVTEMVELLTEKVKENDGAVPGPLFYRLPDIVAMWGMSKPTILRKVKKGEIPAKHLLGTLVFPRDQIDAITKEAPDAAKN